MAADGKERNIGSDVGANLIPRAAGPVKIIFDTDMWSDIDDMFALAMLHALQDRGECDLLAMTSSTEDRWSVAVIDALNAFYGRPGIPIGMVQNGVTGAKTVDVFPWLRLEKSYPQYLCELKKSDGSRLFPQSVSREVAPRDAVSLLRGTLATQPDQSVVIIQVGFSTNLARLLETEPDDACPLPGNELIRRKVRMLSVMAGGIADRDGQPLEKPPREFNLILDVPSAQLLFRYWPTPIVISGLEIGLSMQIRGAELESHFAYSAQHPIPLAYHHVDGAYRAKDAAPGVLHDHGTFDLTSVLFAVRPDGNYFTLSDAGTIEIMEEGSMRVHPGSGQHFYLTMDDLQRARTLEAMMMLSSQPPLGRSQVQGEADATR